jgi:hypothetical protein
VAAALLAGSGLWITCRYSLNRDALTEELLSGIRWQNAAAVKRALDAGASANASAGGPGEIGPWDRLVSLLTGQHSSRGGTPALVLAAESGITTSARLLLEAGARVDDRDIYGRSALMVAAAKGDLPLIDLLVKNGANVNAQDASGTSVLNHGRTYPGGVIRDHLAALGAK